MSGSSESGAAVWLSSTSTLELAGASKLLVAVLVVVIDVVDTVVVVVVCVVDEVDIVDVEEVGG